MSETGTRGKYVEWLKTVKHMTYTAYSRLATEVKLKIWQEYKPRKVKATA